jgi:hypothetical protein
MGERVLAQEVGQLLLGQRDGASAPDSDAVLMNSMINGQKPVRSVEPREVAAASKTSSRATPSGSARTISSAAATGVTGSSRPTETSVGDATELSPIP